MEEDRANILREMKICRFCLSDSAILTNIYEKDGKQSVPLPLQIMACVAIEVFANDGMPQLICNSCRKSTQQAYNFKQTCKKSDDALKLFLATGTLIKPSFVAVTETQESQESQPPTKKARVAQVVTLNYPVNITKREQSEPDENVEEGEHESQKILGLDEDDISQDSQEEYMQPPRGQKVPHVQTNIYPCPHCERSFPLKQLLDLHKVNHERERSFECKECGRKFFTKYDLGKHLLTHSDDKPFTCVICNKNFSREALLHRHQKTHVDVPKYLCSHCDKTFLTRDDLELHTKKHNKNRPFTCRICDKSFVFKQGLERHEATHSHEKPHKCNYCEASFTSPIKLTRHITSHAGLRPYPCKRCGRTFLLSHHLTRHMRSHYAAQSNSGSPIGQHKCDICSMSFRRKDSLINHSAIHSMVNLRCVICNTAFETAKMVKEHITTHLSGLPYPCDKCDYSFETQDQLEEHEVKHAEMEYEEQIEREVTEEEQQKALQEAGAEGSMECDEYQGEEVDEFTIMNNLENPEIVRRSKREPKIKDYAQFLKDELGSDVEEGQEEEEEEEEVAPVQKQQTLEEDTIKPIVRTEGTKVYTRKTPATKIRMLPQLSPAPTKTASLEQITQPPMTTLEHLGLSKQAVSALPNKQFVDMKIGDKTVRVQKVMMTKAEINAMAKEGKIEFKGNTILLKKTMIPKTTEASSGSSVKPITIESIIDGEPKSSTPSKPVLKKTYQRRTAESAEGEAGGVNKDDDDKKEMKQQKESTAEEAKQEDSQVD